ncbi:CO2+/MG2+ efflux protein ApaG [Stappia sp. 22II-S9-Z10]|nr:CO2+/MG2+ efflux protein ApaG [Stappia sp. 22II-S9-Z10]
MNTAMPWLATGWGRIMADQRGVKDARAAGHGETGQQNRRDAPQRADGHWMYRQTTQSIDVTVEPRYLPEHSAPQANRYVWAYTVTIRNGGLETVQLRRRHWTITNALGQVQEVDGMGVVGEEPRLSPGESFEYTSGCPLTTPSGFMVGRYEMEREDGTTFSVDIPAFSLDMPDARPLMN